MRSSFGLAAVDAAVARHPWRYVGLLASLIVLQALTGVFDAR